MDYDEDVLILQEKIFFSMGDEPDPEFYADPVPRATTNAPDKRHLATTSQPTSRTSQTTNPKHNSKEHIISMLKDTTRHTTPTLSQPAMINGAPETSLQLLRPTTTLSELRMRMDNTHQKFITREGIDIYLTQDVLKRINFEAIGKTKKDKTITLPGRYQVRLKVKPDGRILFFSYHKRGVVKKLLNRAVQRGGECSAQPSN